MSSIEDCLLCIKIQSITGFYFIAGYTEKLFGIGDIKGIIAILGSIAPISISAGAYYSYLNSIFPLSFLLIMNLGFMSALSFPVMDWILIQRRQS